MSADNEAAYGIYRAMVVYLRNTGWTREEEGSSWWWKPGDSEFDVQIGEAVVVQLLKDGIDIRVMIEGEPQAIEEAVEV